MTPCRPAEAVGTSHIGQVYAQVIQRQRVDYDLVWKLMRFNDEPETWQAPRRGAIGHRIGQMPTAGEPATIRGGER